jgi:cytochrome c-type biogenesis protein CcmH
VRRAAWLAALAVAALAVAALAAAPGTASAVTPRTNLYAVESQVMCVTCGIPLLEAQSAQADDERTYIQTLVDQGHTLAYIKAALVSEYGNEVLALPPASGFDTTVYVVPIAVVAALIAIVALLLPRWRRRRRERPLGPAVSPLSAADAERLDADLARFDA